MATPVQVVGMIAGMQSGIQLVLRATVQTITTLGMALVVGGCTTPGQSQVVTTPQVAATPYAMPHVKRPNLVVADLERSLVIYRDILGFSAGEPGASSPDSYSYPVFNIPPDVQIRSVTLSEPGEARVLVLTELEGLELPSPPSAPHLSATVIGIEGLAAAFEQIRALGLEVTEPQIARGADFKFVEQAFVDYDGHLIVCYQILPE